MTNPSHPEGPMSLPVNVERHDSTQFDTLRNRIASRIANAALRLASPAYRHFIGGAIVYGMNAAARDVAEGNEPPAARFDLKGDE